ncbi:MAG: 5-oxoprolinase subunit PxpA [Chloroflexi bacterium]|nr:5-oxoprolinase subunit PxpA [Chloroflexota bacterium]
MTTITVNSDMGEGYGLYKIGDDAGIMPYIDVANVACGFHASDPIIMHKTVRLAKKHGVKVGAHPSLPDRQGFGRRVMHLEAEELTDFLIYQVGALKAFLDIEGMELNHIKPHGALYGMAARDESVARVVCEVAALFGVPIFGMANTLHQQMAEMVGVPLVAEFYSDLEYNENGGLIITREHHAVEPAEAARRVHRMLTEGKVRSAEGVDISIRAESICVHSDTPNAVAIARAVKEVVTAFNQDH